MQRSELFRRGIIVPNTEAAKEQLLANAIDTESDVTFLDLEKYGDFEEIFVTGVFSDINAACGVTIDDYEDEIVDWNKAYALINVVKNKQHKMQSEKFLLFFNDLVDAAEMAMKKQMPIFFIF
jgi:hypothetical protein